MSTIVRKDDFRFNLLLTTTEQDTEQAVELESPPVKYPSRLGQVSFTHSDFTPHMAYITLDGTIQTINDTKIGTQLFTTTHTWISALEQYIQPFAEYIGDDINLNEYRAAGFEISDDQNTINVSTENNQSSADATYVIEHHYNGNENFPAIIRTNNDNGDFDP